MVGLLLALLLMILQLAFLIGAFKLALSSKLDAVIAVAGWFSLLLCGISTLTIAVRALANRHSTYVQ